MGDLFERMRWSQPDRVVLTGIPGASEHSDHAPLTVAQSDELANCCANAVLASGAAPGDVLVMACENAIEAILTKIAMAKAGINAATFRRNDGDGVLDVDDPLPFVAAPTSWTEQHNR